MIIPEIIRVSPLSTDRVIISWRAQQSLEPLQDYDFTLERSESNESGFEHISPLGYTPDFVDQINLRKIWKSTVYRIKSTNRLTGDVGYSAEMAIGVAPNLEALEIVRRNNILLKNRRHGIGTPVAVFKRKTQGTSCSCWDPDKQRTKTSNCTECYGTHIDGGFYEPILVWANLTPPAKMVQLPQWGEMEPNEARIFFSNYPELNPKDVIFVQPRMTFYTVEKVEVSSRREVVLHQLISASGVDRGRPYYKLLDKHPYLVDTILNMASDIKVS